MTNNPGNDPKRPRIFLRSRNAPQTTQSSESQPQDDNKLRIAGITISPWMLTLLMAIFSRMGFGGNKNSGNKRGAANNSGGFQLGNPLGCGCRTLGCMVFFVALAVLIVFRVIPIGPFGQ
jgi:hypothetical protein